MKVKVLRDFIDKETKRYNKAGEIVEISEERFKEIAKKGAYVATIATEDKPKGKKKAAKAE